MAALLSRALPVWRMMCLCGRCGERLRKRERELRVQARRLSLASFRALDRKDILRADSYFQQAAAAVAEARLCEHRRVMPRAQRLLERFGSTLAGALRLITSIQCCRIPEKWPTKFGRNGGQFTRKRGSMINTASQEFLENSRHKYAVLVLNTRLPRRTL